MTSKLAARLAVLIDAENTQPALARAIFNETSKYGRSLVRRAYADWTVPRMKYWKYPLLALSIKGIQQFAYTPKKNATDTAMIIDAMDLLHTKQFDGFCLVSSDSDFTPLAMRIRESGLMVYGFGLRHTPKSFIGACDKFTFVETIGDDEQLEAPEGSSAVTTPSETFLSLTMLTCKPKAEKILRDAVNASADKEGWAALRVVEKLLTKQDPFFTNRWFGNFKIGQILKRTGFFDIDHRPSNRQDPYAIYVRDKHFERSKHAAIVSDERSEAPQASLTVNPPPEQLIPDMDSILNDPQLVKTLRDAVEAVSDKEGWADFNLVRRYITIKHRNLAARWFECCKISTIFKGTDLFDIIRRPQFAHNGRGPLVDYARNKDRRPSTDAVIVSGEQLEAPGAIPATTQQQEHPASVVLEEKSEMERILQRAVATFSDEEGWATCIDVGGLASHVAPDLYAKLLGRRSLRKFAANSRFFETEFRTFHRGLRVNDYVLREKRAGRSMEIVACNDERPAAPHASSIATSSPQEHTSSRILESNGQLEKGSNDQLDMESNAEPDTEYDAQLESNARPEKETNARPETNARLDIESNAEPDTENDAQLESNARPETNARLDMETNARPDTESDDAQLEGNARPEKETSARPEKETSARPEKKSSAHVEEKIFARLRASMGANLQKEIAAELERMLRRAIKDSPSDEEGWCDLVKVHDQVSRRRPGFSARNVGYTNFFDLVTAIGPFETRQTADKATRRMYVRVRHPDKSKGDVLGQYGW
ncbi:hypothetical protein LX32DRAFT_566908 [Colletotrichum zoysiae]|uniref:HTH OST-type domain-containing protein n=1 Tax=Colletotrichum zoysiae TaxID=1216348 RepID=A0AAD9HDQ2_9PEZI|nr:hypothetical protein LX32DRAFT_566908 [Colletotrichum zoysiae]